MKKGIFLFILLLFVSGCGSKPKLLISEEEIPSDLFEIYKVNDYTTIYSEFEISYQNKKSLMSLHEALEKGFITIEEILNKMESVDALNDGGSVSFKYETKMNDLANKDFYLVRCKKLNDEWTTEEDRMYKNENIYISTSKDRYDLFDYCNSSYKK